MKDFWQLLSLMTSLAGFLIVAGTLLARGEDLFSAAIRAIVVFAILWAIQNVLRAMLNMTTTAVITTDQPKKDI